MLGHPELITPENKSQFEAMTEYLRKHHVAMKHQDAVIATDFRHGLAPIIGKMGAYRVARQITRAASLNIETGLAYVRAFDLYEELYENRVKVNMKFDPTR